MCYNLKDVKMACLCIIFWSYVEINILAIASLQDWADGNAQFDVQRILDGHLFFRQLSLILSKTMKGRAVMFRTLIYTGHQSTS